MSKGKIPGVGDKAAGGAKVKRYLVHVDEATDQLINIEALDDATGAATPARLEIDVMLKGVPEGGFEEAAEEEEEDDPYGQGGYGQPWADPYGGYPPPPYWAGGVMWVPVVAFPFPAPFAPPPPYKHRRGAARRRKQPFGREGRARDRADTRRSTFEPEADFIKSKFSTFEPEGDFIKARFLTFEPEGDFIKSRFSTFEPEADFIKARFRTFEGEEASGRDNLTEGRAGKSSAGSPKGGAGTPGGGESDER